MASKLVRKQGFPQRHQGEVRKTPFLPDFGELPYHRSPVTLSLIRKDVSLFGNDTTYDFENDIYMRMAVNHTRKCFQLSSPVPMIHLNDVFSMDLPIWSSSPGLPWTTFGYKKKDDIRKDPEAIRSVRYFWHRVKRGDVMAPPDCSAYVRSHLCEYGETKVRAVWGYPATMTFGEAVFALPLIEAYQKGGFPIAYGYETAIGGTMRIRKRFAGNQYFSALDYKSFDKTVPKWLIQRAFDILEVNLDFSVYREYGVARSVNNYRMFNFIQKYFVDTPIRICSGERFRKHSGIASGSYFTQLIGSIVNHILLTWVCYKKFGSPPNDLIVFGDDSLIKTEQELSLISVQDMLDPIGMRINLKKSATSRSICDLTFLGYTIGDGGPSKPYDMWLSSLLFPEQSDREWDDVASRAVGLLYACSGQDSRFDNLCRTIIRLKSFDLRISRGMGRMLSMIGVTDVSIKLPTQLEFAKRLKLL